ncbi:hypothetical protein KFK09_006288 [Dendrobium nobile]|uniref:Centromere-associated protein E n=1 Tax=Dendrobium nobile TaxID=94219 RepID=A0A8T3BNW4_DENNO|nr:hypothetical protein KFK09_006288 [Dendrobium nobile]
MDKSKTRTDMLAAGRKKLQQFRQKKDNKAGGSHAKSSSQVNNPGNEGESEELSKLGHAAPASAADAVDANLLDASDSGADQRAEELRLKLEQIPADFAYQEAHGVVLEKSNGSSSGVGHYLDATFSSGISHEVSETSSSSEVVFENGGDLSVSCVNSGKQNGGSHQMEKGAMWGETSSSTLEEPIRLEETNESSALVDRAQGSGLNLSLSEEIDKYTYPEQNLENLTSSQRTCPLAAISHEGVSVVSWVKSEMMLDEEKVEDQENLVLEDKRKVTTDPAVCGSKRSEEINQCFNPAEESQYAGMNISHESNEGTFNEKKIEIPSSSRGISVDNEELHLELGERTNEGGIELPMDYLTAKEGCLGRQSKEAVSAKEIILDARKKGLSSLQGYLKMDSSIGGQLEQDGVLMKASSAVELDNVKRHLYLSFIAKDILQLQLVEQTQLNEDFHQHSSYEVHRLFDLVKKAQESKEMLTEELVQSKSELQFLAIMKDEIETNFLSARKEIEQEYIKCFNLKSELHKSQEDLLHVSNELAICQCSVDALQKENSNLLATLLSETHAKKKLVEEVEFLSTEQSKLTAALMEEADARKKIAEERELLSTQNMNLLSQLTAKEEKLKIAIEKKVELQDNLRELWSYFEKLFEENFYLSCNLDICNAKIKEMESGTFVPSCHGQEGQISNDDLINSIDLFQPFYEESNVNVSSSTKLKSNSQFQDHGCVLQKDDGKDSDSFALLKVLKEHLQEAKTKLQDLEKSVQMVHSDSLFLSGSSGIGNTAGVSKLIKAFESKAHHVGGGVDEVPSTLGVRSEDSYALSREHTLSLSNALNKIELELGKVEILVMDSQHDREALKKYKMDCETQKHQNDSLQVAFDELARKVPDYESKLCEMHKHIDELHQHVNEEAAGFLDEIELLKNKVSEDAFILKQERDDLLGMIMEAVGKLDASTGLKVLENLDIISHAMVSVDAAILAIEKLNDKVEEINHNYSTLHDSHKELNKSVMDIEGRHAFVIELFYKFYGNLMDLIHEAQQNTGDFAINANANAEKVLDFLPEKCEMAINYLRKLFSEWGYLLSRNTELDLVLSIRNQEIEELNTRLKELELQSNIKVGLESTLLNKTKEIEEVKRRCFRLANQLENHESCKDLYVHGRSWERGDVVVSKDDNVVVNSFISLLLRLEELVSFHLYNYDEILEQIMLSKKHIQDAYMLMDVSTDDCSLPLPALLSDALIPKVIALHERLKLLTVSNVQNETEIQILKEGMSKIEETLEASCHELQLKTSEIEQLEQKLSSVREKLGIAVAKGKGLIVQRDSLKQSLIEKTSELEKSAQDLLLKDSLLDELETKLKSCSEVERIEALESELSYIRNSATVLRDSFLQKDSVLQRIEEVLEDLELPDDFHDKDILEKIELLSRFVIDHPSSTVTDLEQKSLEERTHSDAERCAVIDANKCTGPGSNLDFDVLKQKHEELQSKFYGLAEHNDMLEQSLLERNNLVQKWEELLDRIELPSHMQTTEPEDKIEWLGRELSEVNQEKDSLQLKIDNLETSLDMLTADVEESHKKLSELTAEVSAAKSEKEFFVESLEKLRIEHFSLSEKAVHDERNKENLQKELDDLRDKLIDNAQFEYYKDIENKLQKLHYLINSTLMEHDKLDFIAGGSLVEHLEESLKKLIDNYTAHLNKSSNIVPTNETLLGESSSDHGKIVPDESSPVHGKMVPEEALLAKESGLASMSLELDRISNKLSSVEQDRDSIFVKCQSLILEVEDLKMQVDVQRNADLEKYQSLALELDAMEKQRDSLQELLTLEEQKNASLKEKLNLAVRKGKGLVQQRDSLKQTVDEMNTFLGQLKIDHSQQIESLISEKSLLMHRLADVELKLQDSNQNYSRLLTTLNAIDLESEDNDIDPFEKLRVVNSILLDLRSSTAAAEREANKSKRAAELLITELNEVQERNDILQDELLKAEASLSKYSKQKDDSLSRLEHVMSVHFEERTRLAKNLMDSILVIDYLKEGLLQSSKILSVVLSKDVDLFNLVDAFWEFTLDEFCSSDKSKQLVLISSGILSSNEQKNEEISLSISDSAPLKIHQNVDETLLFEHFALANQALHECKNHCNALRERICNHSVFLDKKAVYLSETVEAVKRRNSALKDTSESLKREIIHLESKLKQKDAKISSIYRNLTVLYEACSTLVMETFRRKSQITGNTGTLGENVLNLDIFRTLPSYANMGEVEDVHSMDDCIKMMVESILSTVKDTNSTNELVERTERELKATVLALQRELQEKDIQMNRVCEELVSQIKDAETVAKRSMADLDSSRAQFSNLEKKAEAMETNRNLLELRLNELQNVEALSKLLQERINSLTESVNAKDQEIEALMQALDEEETQMEALESRNKDMENLLQQRVVQLEILETSNAKTMAKLSTTVSKFDELHNLSETLLLEVENLQSQLHQRDLEISFLRKEVTRCTNDVLASQENSKKYSLEVHELLTWMSGMVSYFGGPPVQFDDQETSQIHLYIGILGKKIASTINELEELRATVQSKDALLETERGRIEELLSRTEGLESYLHGKERLEQSQGGRGSDQQSSNSSGALEIEQMVQRNKASSGPIAAIVRSGRKVNNDHIAIAIDSEKDDGALEDEDDDKAHGFKSLTMSRLVPRATRPIVDRIDGIWVSAERLLMRQPSLRLAFLIYWVALHALLASFI